MGVRGLTSFISAHSDSYLKPIQFRDSYLVVDGNNIASQLYTWTSTSDSAFGGDYDEYYKIVHQFFTSLQKCDITPIVLFDGGYEQKKVRTVCERQLSKFLTLKNVFNSSFSTVKFFPLLMKQTFCNVLEDLSVKCFQCFFEADNEIAAVARQLNCPVLSYDSDFYIFDVLYIPFSTMTLIPVKVDKSDGCVEHHMACSLYDVNNFLRDFEGLDKSLLPLLATLLGNDYIKNTIFNQFLNNHIWMPKTKNMRPSEKKIHGILHWLKNENLKSATELMLNHLKKKDADKIIAAIDLAVNDYTKFSSSVLKFLNIKHDEEEASSRQEETNFDKNLPSTTLENFHLGRLPSFVIDMISLKTYFTPLQIEDVKQPSAHVISFPIIAAIYKIMTSYTKQVEELKLYLRMKGRLSNMKLTENENSFVDIDFANLYCAPLSSRTDFMFQVLHISESEKSIVSQFPDNWKLFIMSSLVWINTWKDDLTAIHFHAFLLSAVATQVVQKRIGYYKKNSDFRKQKSFLLQSIKSEEPGIFSGSAGSNLPQLLSSVNGMECLSLTEIFIPFHKTNENVTGRAYNIANVHLFASFQSHLYHLMQLNALLNYPFTDFRISEFYNGTFLHNLIAIFKKKNDVLSYIMQVLQPGPTVAAVYGYLIDLLTEFIPQSVIKKNKTNKKKKSKKNVCLVAASSNSELADNSSENEYADKNNPYFALHEVDFEFDGSN